jgi:hypothetical protein
MKYYSPKKSNWKKAIVQAKIIQKKLGAEELIDMRIARGGCFVGRYFMGVKKVKGIECDVMLETKVYDNLPYLSLKTFKESLEGK